jgi:hypothetical protein
MPNMTVPMQAGGSKSLPAELKVGGGAPFWRLRAEHPGYGWRTRSGFPPPPQGAPWLPGNSPEAVAGLLGLGDVPWLRGGSAEETAGLMGVYGGSYNPLVLNPVVGRLRPDVYAGMYGLGDETATIDFSQITGIDPNTGMPPVDIPIVSYTPDQLASLDQTLAQFNTAIPAGSFPGITATTLPAGVTPPQPPPGYAWAQVLDATGKNIAQILAISQGGSSTTLPNGLRIIQGSQAGAVQGAAGGLLSTGVGTGILGGLGGNTILLFGMGLLLVMVISGGGRR